MTEGERAPIRVVGRYALYNEIAAGGMATIHLGRLLGPVGFARTVAVKRLHPQFAKDPEFVSMFLDEARLAARVQHPNVVATIDVVATDGELFLIMDYVRGESLSKILRAVRKRGERVPPRIAAAIMCGFLHGLHTAHEAKNERGEPLGLVHRDVSPQNVLVGADGIARVLDFGIAKAAGRIQVTRDGQIKGKLAYMPPEQLSGREVSRAVDIYASAVVMWETLTATRLFKGETEAETLAKILRDPVPPPSAVALDLPPAFDAPLLKALQRGVSKRHSTARELALELERCCGIASPTEVGEWVEALVGHVLVAREAQIAEIESSSAGMPLRPSGRATLPESPSDSDMSLPSVRAIHAASPTDTLPMGSGPPVARRGGRPSDRHGMASALATAAPVAGGSGGVLDETTASKSSAGFSGILSSTMMLLPVDRRLPVIASVAGVLVLVVVMIVVLAGKFSSDRTASAAARAPIATGDTASTATPPPSTAPSDTSDDVPEPPPVDEPAADEADEPAADEPVTATHDAPKRSPKPPSASPTAKTPATSPRASAGAPPAARKDCVPPYTIDATGHRKYKLECL